MRWHTAAEAGWNPIDHVFTAVRLSVDPAYTHRMKGKDIVIFKVQGKHRDSYIKLRFEEIDEKKVSACITLEDGNGKVTPRRGSINPSDGTKKGVEDEQFIDAYQKTRTNQECADIVGRSASWVSRNATKLRKQGITLRRSNRPPDTMNIYGQDVLTRRFIHAWNHCPDLDAVISHLNLSGLREKNKIKSRLSIMAGRFRDVYGVEMRVFPRGRRVKKVKRIQPKPLLPPPSA